MVSRLFRPRLPQDRFDRAARAFRLALGDENCPCPPASAWLALQDGQAARNDQDLTDAAERLEREVRQLHARLSPFW